MIGLIKGEVARVGAGYCIVDCNGVGYKVAAPKDVLSRLSNGDAVSLWTHLAVREDAMELFGFASEDDLSFFELLLTVPGVGPRSSLAILNVAPAETLRAAIAAGNATYLTNVSGIGKKTAQKILLELKDKVGLAAEGSAAQLAQDEEALEAMRALGYSLHEARDALAHVPESVTGSRERLREALRMTGKQ